jgi:hypothetical protein
MSEYDSWSDDSRESVHDGVIRIKFVARSPAVMIVLGRSKIGKSQFIMELLVNDHTDKKPKVVYLVVQSGDSVNLMDKVEPFVVALKFAFNPNVPELRVCSSLLELNQQLADDVINAHEPKLIIIDDWLFDTVPTELYRVVNETSHHANALVIITSQVLFAKGGAQLRYNADYLVVFPVSACRSLKLFLNEFPDLVKKNMQECFTTTFQNHQHGVHRTEPLPIPVIVDKSIDGMSDGMRIWFGLEDASPVKINEQGDKNSTQSSKLVSDYIVEHMK